VSHLPTLARNLFLTLTLFLTITSQASYQTGLNAYNAARYTTALENWLAVTQQPPAEVNPAIYAETHYAIGMLHWMGLGVTKDYFEASKWFQKAAELGNPGAQGKLGYLYTEAITVQKDYNRAFTWFSKAAKQGDIDGQYNLGIFYLNGWGTEKDETMAAQYLAAASAQGDKAAETALQGLLPELTKSTPQKSTPPQPEKRHRHPRESGDLHPFTEIPKDETQTTLLTKTWILTQNPDHYTIQVIGLSTIPKLKNLIKNHQNLSPLATYTITQNNQPLHMLIQGTYRSLDAARKARDNIPPSIQKPGRFWIRNFSEIQALIQQK